MKMPNRLGCPFCGHSEEIQLDGISDCPSCSASGGEIALACAVLNVLPLKGVPHPTLKDLRQNPQALRLLYSGADGALPQALENGRDFVFLDQFPSGLYGHDVAPDLAETLGRLSSIDENFACVVVSRDSEWLARVGYKYMLFECARILAPGGKLILQKGVLPKMPEDLPFMLSLSLRSDLVANDGDTLGVLVAEKIACETSEERFIPAMGGEIAYEHWHRYCIASKSLQGKRVLDAGCGDGYGSYLMGLSAQEVCGIDLSAEVIRRAQSLYAQPNLHFDIADLSAIPYPSGSFELATCFEVIEHMDSPANAIIEMKRVLRTDGVLLLSTPNPSGPKGMGTHANPYHSREFTLLELRQLLTARFEHVRFFGQGMWVGSHCWPVASDEAPEPHLSIECSHLTHGTVPAFFIAVCGDRASTVDPIAQTVASGYRNSFLELLESKNHLVSAIQSLQIQHATRTIDRQDADNCAARMAIADKDAEIARARETISNNGTEIATARRDLDLQYLAVNTLQAHLADLEKEIWRQQEQLTRQREEFEQVLRGLDAFHCCLDTPKRGRSIAGSVNLAGWIFHETEEIVEVQIKVGQSHVDARCAMDRPDVRERHVTFPHSLRSGFQAQITLPPGKHKIRFEVQTASGYSLTFDPDLSITIRRALWNGPLIPKAKCYTLLAFRLATFAYRHIAQHRRFPPLVAVYSALRSFFLHPINVHSWRSNEEDALSPIPRYDAWLDVNKFTPGDRLLVGNAMGTLKTKPLFSIIMPIYKPDMAFLRDALQSIDDQVYDRWELCASLDGPHPSNIETFLGEFFKKNINVHLSLRPERGGISACSNAAAQTAHGDWLVFLDQDDLLSPDALAEFASRIDANPSEGVIYSDHDKINSSGSRFDPEFKPDFSPELLLSYMYFGHALAVRRDLFESVGGLRSNYDGSQDYDLALRLVETGSPVGHIPRILYHWRAHSASTASSGSAKPSSIEAGRQAVENALRRRGAKDISVLQPVWAASSAVGIFALEFQPHGPAVTIIIPTRNNLRHLRRCIESLSLTAYDNWHVAIADDSSDDPSTLDYLKALASDRFTVWTLPRSGSEFNFSAVVNEAVSRCTTEFILLLNDDTEIMEPRWLSQMMGYAQLPGVGAVGAKLLFPDRRVQHAGVILGMDNGLAGHAYKLAPDSYNGYLSYMAVARNYSAVTAACLLTRQSLYAEVGGFDSIHLAVAYNDVDYCMKLESAGYRSVYVPSATLIHHEGVSRGRGLIDSVREEAFFRQKLRRHGPDRYYNPNLSLEAPFLVAPRKLARPTSPPLHLLAVTPWLNHTGAPLQQYAVIKELKTRGSIDSKVLCPFDGPLRAAYEACGIAVETPEHPLRRCRNRHDLDQITAQLARDYQSKGAQVAFVTTLDAFFAVAAAHKAGIPCIWAIHESVDWQGYFAHLPAYLRQAVRECFAFPYKLVFVSQATANLYRNATTGDHFEIIHNGIDPRLMRAWKQKWPREKARNRLRIKPDEVAILSVGTVCERKGQLDLVEAFAALDPQTLAMSRCIIVGDRPGIYNTKLHYVLSALAPEVRRRIQIVPETDDVALYYRAANMFVCTSRIESYPLTILEAMHMGLPVITTPVFGIVEQVRNGVNGIFYTPSQIGELANAIHRLANDAQERSRMARNGKHMLRRLNTFGDMVSKYCDLFAESSQIFREVPREKEKDIPQ